LSIVFAGQNVGIREVADKIWLVSFMNYDLGFFDQECGRVTSAENPFEAKVLPMCPVRTVTRLSGIDPQFSRGQGGNCPPDTRIFGP